MKDRSFTVSRAQARELEKINRRMARKGGIPHAVIRRDWLAAMTRELQRMAKSFERTGRGAKELLEALLVAEAEGVDAATLAAIRRDLGDCIKRRRAA